MQKKIFFLCLLYTVFACKAALDNGSFSVPKYDGSGPRNVYYLTGAGDQLFAGWEIWGNQDGWSEPYIALHNAYVNRGYQFFTSLPKKMDSNFFNNVFTIFCHNVPRQYVKEKNLVKKILVLMTEPPHVFPNNYKKDLTKDLNIILTWDDKLVDNQKYFKYHFVQASLKMIDNVTPFKDKKLCTFIGGNKNFRHKNELYSKRREAIDFFERYASRQFDFYGKKWDPKKYHTYRGPVKSKTETLKNYKFSICYENICKEQGYITEKIFGSFVAGCVPIYWGAENITDYIPANCFIDRREFSSMEQVYKFISTMKEERYNQYLENIRLFLNSNEAKRYSIDSFVNNLMKLNARLVGVTL